jgi:hypothetical protein
VRTDAQAWADDVGDLSFPRLGSDFGSNLGA